MDWVTTLALRAAAKPLFRGLTPNAEGRARALKAPAPKRRYAMFFTPRSGSSRVTAAAQKAGVLSNPDECFNPLFVPQMAQALGAQDLDDYLHVLTHRRNGHGTFGCQITYAQLVQVFGTGARFHRKVAPDSAFWLIRHDIVAQAVSVTRMIQTEVAHSAHSSARAIQSSEERFDYDARAIATYVQRIAWMERQTETYFRRFGPEPLRLSYEQLAAMAPREILEMMSDHVGSNPLFDRDYETDHEKLPGTKAHAFAARFREEHGDLMSRIDASRAAMLTRHPKPAGA